MSSPASAAPGVSRHSADRWEPPVVLVIGGADPSGCYGVAADLRTLAAHRCHGAMALTVVTAQNTLGLRAAHPLPVDLVVAQIEAILDDLPVAAVKAGMLGRVEVVRAVSGLAAAGRLPNLVVDAVLADRHGRPLFGAEVVVAYRALVGSARLVTLNRDEAALLTGRTLTHPDQLAEAAPALGVPTLVTGGRLPGTKVIDAFWDGGTVHRLEAARIDTPNVAGTGDAASAAVAARLAAGEELGEAVRGAVGFVRAALVGGAGWRLGGGPGPIDHLGWAG